MCNNKCAPLFLATLRTAPRIETGLSWRLDLSATDVVPISLFISPGLLPNRLQVNVIPPFQFSEQPREYGVESFMKMKSLFGLVAAVGVAGFAAAAHAGWSVNVSVGAPVPVWTPPPVIVAPPCPPTVVAGSPVVIPPAPVIVYQPVPVYRPVVYPYPAPRYGYLGYYGHGHGPRGWGPYNRPGYR